MIGPGRGVLGWGRDSHCKEVFQKGRAGEEKKKKMCDICPEFSQSLTVMTGSLEKRCRPDSLRSVIREFRIPALIATHQGTNAHNNELTPALSNLCNY